MAKLLFQLFNTAEGLDAPTLRLLIDLVERNNLPGFDYIEFKQSVAKLMDMNMDETLAYRSAFATFSTLDVDKPRLLETAKHYQSLLVLEQTKFGEILLQQQAQGIAAKLEEIKAYKSKITDWKEEILKLQSQIENATLAISEADAAIAARSEKIDSAKSNFETAYHHVFNTIEADIVKIQTLL